MTIVSNSSARKSTGKPELDWDIYMYFLHYIIQIISIVLNIYSVDEGDLQRDEVVISICHLRSTGSIAGGSFQIHFSPEPLKI